MSIFGGQVPTFTDVCGPQASAPALVRNRRVCTTVGPPLETDERETLAGRKGWVTLLFQFCHPLRGTLLEFARIPAPGYF